MSREQAERVAGDVETMSRVKCSGDSADCAPREHQERALVSAAETSRQRANKTIGMPGRHLTGDAVPVTPSVPRRLAACRIRLIHRQPFAGARAEDREDVRVARV